MNMVDYMVLYYYVHTTSMKARKIKSSHSNTLYFLYCEIN